MRHLLLLLVLGLQPAPAYILTRARDVSSAWRGRGLGREARDVKMWARYPEPHRDQATRKGFLLSTFSLTVGAIVVASPASAQEGNGAAALPPDVLAEGVVRLGKGMDVERIGDTAALYVTARVGGRGPVLASIRVPNPSFPLDFRLKESDVYAPSPEEQHKLAEAIRTQDLVVSARLDKDGQASTRDPEDLVGQGRVFKFGVGESSQWSRAVVELQGRGAFGEFVTRQQQQQKKKIQP